MVSAISEIDAHVKRSC